MGGKGAEFLTFSFDRLVRQTYRDFEVVISDQSTDSKIKEACDRYGDKLDIRYLKEPTGKRASSVNINNAIRNARGKIIKVLFLDDYLYHNNALKDIVDNFDLEKDHWLVTPSIHTHDGIRYYRPFYPYYDDAKTIYKNTISSPSVLAIKNDNPLLFDESMIWWMDLDYYKRCYDRFGMPKVIIDINVVNREGAHQVTNTTATEKRREAEFKMVIKKFNLPRPHRLIFMYKAQRYKKQAKSFIKRLLRK